MNDTETSYDSSSTCCAWPLILVLASLLIVNSVQFISILRERSAAKQVTENAGDYQVDDARRFATLNVGGSATTTVSFIVSRD